MMNVDDMKGHNEAYSPYYLQIDDHKPSELKVDDYGIYVRTDKKFYIAERLQFPSGIYEGIKKISFEEFYAR